MRRVNGSLELTLYRSAGIDPLAGQLSAVRLSLASSSRRCRVRNESPVRVRTSAWCTRRSIMAVATMSSPKVSPQRPNGRLRGDDDRAFLVAGGHELEEQVRRIVVERDVADLVDDDQLVAADLLQLDLELTGVVGGGQPGDPVAGGVEQDRVAGVGGFDAQPDREVCLVRVRVVRAGSRSPSSAMNIAVARCASTSRRSDGRWSRLKSSRVLTCGKWAVRMRMVVPADSRSAFCRGQHRGQVFLVRPVLIAGLVGQLVPDPRRSSGSSTPGPGRRSATAILSGKTAGAVTAFSMLVALPGVAFLLSALSSVAVVAVMTAFLSDRCYWVGVVGRS